MPIKNYMAARNFGQRLGSTHIEMRRSALTVTLALVGFAAFGAAGLAQSGGVDCVSITCNCGPVIGCNGIPVQAIGCCPEETFCSCVPKLGPDGCVLGLTVICLPAGG